MTQQPACLVPFIGVLVDVNKKVRPCCAYEVDEYPYEYPGDLKKESISEIRNNKKWIKIKEDLTNQQVIDGCKPCFEREQRAGWSVRKDYQNDGNGYSLLDWTDEKLQMIEFNGSNICNLACMHCSPKFSTAWISLGKKMSKILPLRYNLKPEDVVTKSNPELIKKNLNELDLSKLQWITLKGGEPLLNEETQSILEYLLEKNVLQRIVVYVTTNGTVYNERMIWLLGQTKNTFIMFSIDGNAKLNPYIRWSNRNFATLDKIENTIELLSSYPNIDISITTSVMIYNIFSLIDIRDWWLGLIKKYPNNVRIHKNIFENVVTTTNVSVRNLTDLTRQNLIKFYQENQSDMQEFVSVINELSKDYFGHDRHNLWVDYTLDLDQIRGTSILEVEPRLTSELVKL
jgi:sulfatase maturation enzyme AslB (radical SAM superfamily)